MRSPREVPCPVAKAEGDIAAEGIDAVPYDTSTVNSRGCHVHLWLGRREATAGLLKTLTAIARANRDVVSISYSTGEPTGYWARTRMSRNT